MTEVRINPLVRLFWKVIHLLPWSMTRWVCDLCAEFPQDPSSYFEDD